MAKLQQLRVVPVRQVEDVCDRERGTRRVVLALVVVAEPHRLAEHQHKRIERRDGQIASWGAPGYIGAALGVPVARRREIVDGTVDGGSAADNMRSVMEAILRALRDQPPVAGAVVAQLEVVAALVGAPARGVAGAVERHPWCRGC